MEVLDYIEHIEYIEYSQFLNLKEWKCWKKKLQQFDCIIELISFHRICIMLKKDRNLYYSCVCDIFTVFNNTISIYDKNKRILSVI